MHVNINKKIHTRT